MNVRLACDTSRDIEEIQIERWRQMSPADKAALVTALTRAAHEMALVGVRHRYPTASPREQFLRRGVVLLGPELARQVYPEIAALDPP